MGSPGLMVIEAPMGEGKTEAALIAADILACKFGCRGLYFALPTQATANSIHIRVSESGVLERCAAGFPYLQHGRAELSRTYEMYIDEGKSDSGKPLQNWFSGRKRILADVVVGTVDNVLMSALKVRHVSLRHLGLSEKVVVIDECHSFDEYMGSYLRRTLSWLSSLDVTVILLSATLSDRHLRGIVGAYTGGKPDKIVLSPGYPRITTVADRVSEYYPEQSAGSHTVEIRWISPDMIPESISEYVAGGSSIAIIVNTIEHAQEVYDTVVGSLGCETVLLHSGFTNQDRYRKVRIIAESLKERREGSFRPFVVVSTQILEQSLDLDFDVMVTDLCPADVFLQRLGRLHRHVSERPAVAERPICFILDSRDGEIDPGSKAVYGEYQLLNSRIILGDSVSLPEDISLLVNRAYSPDPGSLCENREMPYLDAKERDDQRRHLKERRAETYQLSEPGKNTDLTGMMCNSVPDPELHAIASVRDTDERLDVILLYRDEEGLLHTISGCEIGGLAEDSILRDSDSIALPRGLVNRIRPHRLINELKRVADREVPKEVSFSDNCRDSLFLVLDSNMNSSLLGTEVRYDHDRGFMYV